MGDDKLKANKNKIKEKPLHFKKIRNKHNDGVVNQTQDGYGDGVNPNNAPEPEVNPDVRND